MHYSLEYNVFVYSLDFGPSGTIGIRWYISRFRSMEAKYWKEKLLLAYA